MEIQDLILSRRSIRKYENKSVTPENIKKILQAAMAAPSAVAMDPWFFYALTEKEKLSEMAQILPYGKMLNHAPLAIVVCGDKDRAYLGDQDELGYMVQDCSAAIQNLMLSAHGLGIGSVWLGVYPQKDRMEKVRQLLDIPSKRVPLAVISLGYPDETQPARTRYKEENVAWIDN